MVCMEKNIIEYSERRRIRVRRKMKIKRTRDIRNKRHGEEGTKLVERKGVS